MAKIKETSEISQLRQRVTFLEKQCGRLAAAAESFQRLNVAYRMERSPSDALDKRLKRAAVTLAEFRENSASDKETAGIVQD